MENFLYRLLTIPLFILMLYGMYYAMFYWVYILIAMVPILGIAWLFGLYDPSASTAKSDSSPEGTYTVYDLGKEKVQVDRYHITKN